MLMMKKPKNLEFEPYTQKMCSLFPLYTKFPVYFFGFHSVQQNILMVSKKCMRINAGQRFWNEFLVNHEIKYFIVLKIA
jgi:hypothetical protein